MFDKLSRPRIEAYDGKTGEYLGTHVFRVTSEAENLLLNYANNKNKQNRIILQDVSFYPASERYVMPQPYEKYNRRGHFRAMFRDKYSMQWVPVEMEVSFNIMARAHPEEGRYHFDSIEYSDIQLERMTILTEYISNPKL